MDNLTHSLVGATLGQMGLKKKTGLAIPTLIIAANLPDVDAACLMWLDMTQQLSVRRGITHGPVAMLVLPILLWALMLAFDHWQGRRGKRPAGRAPIHRGWLLAIAYIGCLSHPALDWLNNYGVRLLEPFSSQWFYGDTLFIIDLLIWAALGLSMWLSLRRERRGAAHWQRPAWIGFVLVSAYIFANGLITGMAERNASQALIAVGHQAPLVVANPPPFAFWRRDVIWRTSERYGAGSFALGRGGTLDIRGAPTGMKDARIAAWARYDPTAQSYLFWSRMPVAKLDGDGIMLSDQRFMDGLRSDPFTYRLMPHATSPSE